MQGKTKEQPISELTKLRQRVADLLALEDQHRRAEEALRGLPRFLGQGGIGR